MKPRCSTPSLSKAVPGSLRVRLPGRESRAELWLQESDGPGAHSRLHLTSPETLPATLTAYRLRSSIPSHLPPLWELLAVPAPGLHCLRFLLYLHRTTVLSFRLHEDGQAVALLADERFPSICGMNGCPYWMTGHVSLSADWKGCKGGAICLATAVFPAAGRPAVALQTAPPLGQWVH